MIVPALLVALIFEQVAAAPAGGHAPARAVSAASEQFSAADSRSGLSRAEKLDQLYARLADRTLDEENSEKIIAAIEMAWLESGSETVNFIMDRVLTATRSQNYDLSIKLLTKVTEIAPDYAEGWNQLAVAYYLSENYDHALPPLLRALSLDHRHFKAIEGYGVLMREMNNKRAALSAFRKVLAINPHSATAREAEAELSRDIDGQGI